MTPSCQPAWNKDDDFEPVYTMPDWYRPLPQSRNDAPKDAPPPDSPAFTPFTEEISCRICFAAPAAEVVVRAHQGLLLAMRWKSETGPFCGVCGIAVVRRMTTATLWQGWWSPLSLVLGAPFALLSNLFDFLRLRRLQPTAPLPGWPQAPLGRPVLHRPLAYVALVPLIWATVMITLWST
ncbi:hypothetical protein [Streptomyces sp. NPDC002671]